MYNHYSRLWTYLIIYFMSVMSVSLLALPVSNDTYGLPIIMYNHYLWLWTHLIIFVYVILFVVSNRLQWYLWYYQISLYFITGKTPDVLLKDLRHYLDFCIQSQYIYIFPLSVKSFFFVLLISVPSCSFIFVILL